VEGGGGSGGGWMDVNLEFGVGDVFGVGFCLEGWEA
jgi:hypothetical protein